MFSDFWEPAYENQFDGGSQLVPVVRPDTDLSVLPNIGRVISHGYLATGYLPIQVAFPYLAYFLVGTQVAIRKQFLLDYFKDDISYCEAAVFKRYFKSEGVEVWARDGYRK